VLDMLSLAFMQRALAAGLIVAVVCPIVGLMLVLRRMAQFGDALAHVSLAGVAVGLLTRTYPVATGLIFSAVASLGMDALRRSYKRYSELSVAVTLSGSLALAVVLLSKSQAPGGETLSYLFGSIMTVAPRDVALIGAVGLVVLAIFALLHKEMLSVTFDEEFARIGGLPVRMVNLVFILLTALTVSIAMRIVSVLLVSALMVVPVAVALQLAKSFKGALAWAVAVGLVSVLGGLYLSYTLDTAPGGTMVLTTVALLFLVLGYKRLRHIE